MGRIFGWVMVILLCVPAGARAECVLANALSQVHMLQVDLTKTPDNPLAGNVLQYIAGQMPHLQENDLARIVEIHPAEDADAVFNNFATHTHQLLQAYQRKGIAAIPLHFDQEQVRRNLRLTGQYLVAFGCLSRATGGQPGQSVLGQRTQEGIIDNGSVETSGETPFDSIKRYLATPKGAATGVFAVAAVVGIAILIRAWIKLRRRRARRYDCHYATRFRTGGRDHGAVILDVSGMGIKLRHGADEPVQIGTQIEVCIFDKWHAGTVAWGNAHYFGILFRHPLSRQDVRQLHKGRRDPVALAA